jgi:hypothetical protein
MLSVLLLLVAGGPETPPQDEAVRIIEKAVAAQGQPNTKGEVATRITGQWKVGNATNHYVSTFRPPNSLHVVQTWVVGEREERAVHVFDGKSGWKLAAGKTSEFTSTELECMKEMNARGGILALENLTDPKQVRLTLLPELKEKDEVYVGVRVQREDCPDTYLYFSKRTYFLCGVTGKKRTPDGESQDVFEYRSEYKEFGGKMFATRTTTKVGDVVRVEEIEKVEFIPVKDVQHLFAKP